MDETTQYHYYYPIDIRYSDLDPQGHVNNTAYLTYLESARLGYYEAVGIWDKHSNEKTGMVVAHIDIDYLAPIFFGQDIRVGIRAERIGTKSLTLGFQIEALPEGKPMARGRSIMVAFDNNTDTSRIFPQDWRKKINIFEKGTEANETA